MHWTFIIPGFLLPAELAKLMGTAQIQPAAHAAGHAPSTEPSTLQRSALAGLVRRANIEPPKRLDGLSHHTARHLWWQTCGWHQSSTDTATGTAALEALAHGLTADGWWWRVHPVHFQLARDHLVLTDPRDLQLQADEADTLAAIAEPLLAEAGFLLHRPAADAWFLHAPQRHSLSTYALERVVGRNITPAMPQGDDARAWRRLLNEVQMSWHDHPVNNAREARGLWPINGLWLEGGFQQPAALQATADKPMAKTVVCASSDLVRGLAAASGTRCLAATDAMSLQQQLAKQAATDTILIELNQLEAAANTQDGHGWITGWQQIEQAWWQPLAALWSGQADQVAAPQTITVHALGHDHVRTLRMQRADRWKLWRNHKLAELLAEPD